MQLAWRRRENGAPFLSANINGTWEAAVTNQPQDDLPPEEPYELPGTEPALEPETLPEHPLRALDVPALLPKDIA